MNLRDPRWRGALVAPLHHPVDAFFIPLKDRFDAAVPAVSNPPLHPQVEGRLPGVMPEENALDHPFDHHMCPDLFHMDRNVSQDILKINDEIGLQKRKGLWT